jgi:hypothetical protein
MDLQGPPGLSPAREQRVKRAAGLHCELCGGAYPADLLEIHLLPGEGWRVDPGPDLQREILVLCPRCHRDVHASRLPRADQKTLVRSRPAATRREIRAILGYAPAPYTPPEADLAAIYDETRQLASFVVNGAG